MKILLTLLAAVAVAGTSAVAAPSSADGAKYLQENAAKEGVQVTKSGLQYKVLRQGSGPKPTRDSTVVVHYKGTLVDGTPFDSSYDRGQPASFGVGQVIKGWTEGLQLMNEGSKYLFVIPSNLAYGSRGAGGIIGPDQTLVFEVDLLKVQ